MAYMEFTVIVTTTSPRLPIVKMQTGLGLDWSGWRYPCLSPLSVLGVAFSSRAQGAGLHIPGCCQVPKIGRRAETQYCSLQFLPPSARLSFPPDSPPLPAPCFPLDTLHSCCHSALSQSQFIPSSWPYRDMHSPGRRGRALDATHAFTDPICSPVQVSIGHL